MTERRQARADDGHGAVRLREHVLDAVFVHHVEEFRMRGGGRDVVDLEEEDHAADAGEEGSMKG